MLFEATLIPSGHKIIVPIPMCAFSQADNGMVIHFDGVVWNVKETIEELKRSIMQTQMQAQMPIQQPPHFRG